ncbi:MAG: hypothetical protein ACKOE9_10260 [Vulcanococcus sp.]
MSMQRRPPRQRYSVGPRSERLINDRLPTLARFYAKNRRDGARLLSSALVITSIGVIRVDHPAGQLVAALGVAVCLYWWTCYRSLER